MSDVSTELTRIENAKAAIKTAVGNKGVNIPNTAHLNDYPGYIGNIDTDVELTTLDVTANGTYTAPSGYDGISQVKVNVPDKVYKSEELSVNANGTYTPGSGVAGFSKVTVNVPATVYNSQTLNATENGTYTPSSGYAGFSSVTVAIPTYDGSVN